MGSFLESPCLLCLPFWYFLSGNIDQAQYCDRIKGIIELLGSKLSLDELTKIWKIQVSWSELPLPFFWLYFF